MTIIDIGGRMPLYEQIVNDLRQKIDQGVFKPGDPIGTYQELATQYGVSLITVKNAVAQLVAEGLLFSRQAKGTFVAEKKMRRSDDSAQKSIGLVLSDINHPYFSMIVHSIEARAYELGFNILLSNSSGSIEKEENQIDHFRTIGVHGVIIASMSGEYKASKYLQRLHKENFPYIMISYIHDPEYWYVGSDNELGGFLATEHLIKAGYESIGYVHAGRNNLLSEVRKNGYYRALVEYGKNFSAENVFVLESARRDIATERYNLGELFCKDFVSLKKKPEALFFYEDMMAMGFIAASRENGISVPEDVAVVGYDDIVLSRYAPVPLTTVHRQVDTVGKLAVETVDKRINKIDVGNRTILKPTLIIRDSCGSKKKSILTMPTPPAQANDRQT